MSTLVAQYFLNHRLHLKEIEWQVEEFAKAGYEGIYAHARQGLLTPYMSEDWWRALDKIMEVCRRVGLEFWIWDEDYFPSGLAGGRVVWGDPGLIATGLEFSTAGVEGAGPFEVDFAPGLLLRAFALERRSDNSFGEILDVTRFCGTRRQKWTARYVLHRAYSPGIDSIGHPHWRCSMGDNRFALSWTPARAGTYLIVAALMRKSEGLHPDLLRPEGIKRFLELSYEPYFQRYGKEFGRLLKGAFTDEPSPGVPLYPWTPGFPEEFRKDHGYDVLEHVAHLAVDIDARSPAVRHHYRLTQHRLQRDNYVGQIARWCEAHGIQAIGHLTRTEWLSLVAVWWPNELRCYQPMHIPAADPLGASCGWSDAASYHTGLKVASSAAHLFGRRQASSDALAVVGDEATIRDLKYMMDYQMVLGINHFTVHGLSYSIDGPRKDEVPPSIFYQHTEWKHMRVLLDHVRETCEALTGGQHVCDLAMLYPSTSLACEAKPGVDWHRLPDEPLIHALVERLLSHQRDFDFIDEVTLQESVTGTGALTTPEAYGVILLPYLRYIDLRTAEALLRFARAGGRVIAIGRMPLGLTADLSSPVREWAGDSVELHEALTEPGLKVLPGVSVEGEGARDVFVLRRRDGDNVKTFAFNRRQGAFEGKIDGVTVSIPPRGSVFVLSAARRVASVVTPLAGLTTNRGGSVSATQPKVEADLSTDWKVSFEANHVPLNFWHASLGDKPRESAPPFAGSAFDLMLRQADPIPQGDNAVRYSCRFMLTGQVPEVFLPHRQAGQPAYEAKTFARLVMEDSTVFGDWKVYVNGVQISGWERRVIFDCRNIEAKIGHALRGGSTPTLNVVTIETVGPGRGLKEVPYLYGSFTCEYRYGHLSLPFLTGCSGERRIDTLAPWNVLGYPIFSGSAVYRRVLNVSRAGEFVLDLGRVEDVASVALDGKPCAVLAWPPYRCSLGPLSPGNHELAVEITNGPGNRNRAAGLVAGLLGPVRLLRG